MVSTTSITTAKASGSLKQLCKHFGREIDVDFSPEAGWIKFDFGRADLKTAGGTLTMQATANSQEDLDRLKHVLSSQMGRLAFRDDLQINWDS